MTTSVVQCYLCGAEHKASGIRSLLLPKGWATDPVGRLFCEECIERGYLARAHEVKP